MAMLARKLRSLRPERVTEVDVAHPVEQRRIRLAVRRAEPGHVAGGVLHHDELVGEPLPQLPHEIEPTLRAGGVAGHFVGGLR